MSSSRFFKHFSILLQHWCGPAYSWLWCFAPYSCAMFSRWFSRACLASWENRDKRSLHLCENRKSASCSSCRTCICTLCLAAASFWGVATRNSPCSRSKARRSISRWSLRASGARCVTNCRVSWGPKYTLRVCNGILKMPKIQSCLMWLKLSTVNTFATRRRNTNKVQRMSSCGSGSCCPSHTSKANQQDGDLTERFFKPTLGREAVDTTKWELSRSSMCAILSQFVCFSVPHVFAQSCFESSEISWPTCVDHRENVSVQFVVMFLQACGCSWWTFCARGRFLKAWSTQCALHRRTWAMPRCNWSIMAWSVISVRWICWTLVGCQSIICALTWSTIFHSTGIHGPTLSSSTWKAEEDRCGMPPHGLLQAPPCRVPHCARPRVRRARDARQAETTQSTLINWNCANTQRTRYLTRTHARHDTTTDDNNHSAPLISKTKDRHHLPHETSHWSLPLCLCPSSFLVLSRNSCFFVQPKSSDRKSYNFVCNEFVLGHFCTILCLLRVGTVFSSISFLGRFGTCV